MKASAASAVSQRNAGTAATVARKQAAAMPHAGRTVPAGKKKAKAGVAKAAGKTAAMAKAAAKTGALARRSAKPPRVAKPAVRNHASTKAAAKPRAAVNKAPSKPSRVARPAAKGPANAKPAAEHVVPPKPAAKAPDAAKPVNPVAAAAKPAVQTALPASPVTGAAEVVKTPVPAVAAATPATPVAKAPNGPKPPLQPAQPQAPARTAHPATAAVAPAAAAAGVAPPARSPEPARPPVPQAGVAKPVSPRPLQVTLQNGRPMPPSRAAAKEEFFVEGDYVVYPTHGVGKVERIATEDIAGHRLELIHITFEENRMTLRVPVTKARSAGLRKLATRKMFDEAMGVLRGRARIKRTMWSRRAQEYEAKINSGDPIAIAEVVRDLHRNAGQPDQSFSERQIYEAAMDRLAAELAALDQTDKLAASVKLVNYLKTV